MFRFNRAISAFSILSLSILVSASAASADEDFASVILDEPGRHEVEMSTGEEEGARLCCLVTEFEFRRERVWNQTTNTYVYTLRSFWYETNKYTIEIVAATAAEAIAECKALDTIRPANPSPGDTDTNASPTSITEC